MPALAALLTLAEWARERWPFGGVPPGGIALGQVSGPLAGTARIGGTVLLVGVTYLAGVALGDLAVAWRPTAPERRPVRARRGLDRAAALSLAVVVALAVWGAVAA